MVFVVVFYFLLIKPQNPRESFYEFIIEVKVEDEAKIMLVKIPFFLIYIFNYINCD